MTGVFDPEAFMNQVTEAEGSTSIIPIPIGEYTAVISEVVPKPFNRDDGSTGVQALVTFDFMDDDGKIREAIGGRDPKHTEGIFLDLDASGGLDMGPGKNVRLNRIREAVGQNRPGVKWGLPMLKGAGPLKVTIGQEPDKKQKDVIYNRLKAVGAIN